MDYDYIVKTKKGEIRMLPQRANGMNGLAYMDINDTLMGYVVGENMVVQTEGNNPYRIFNGNEVPLAALLDND